MITGKDCHWLFWLFDKECRNEHKLNKVAYYLERSLNREYWIDDYTLSPKYGHKVFDYEKKAIEKLMKIEE